MTKEGYFRIARSFGILEHNAGRMLLVPLVIGLLINIKDRVNVIIFIVGIALWAVYICSHSLEKNFYTKAKYIRSENEIKNVEG